MKRSLYCIGVCLLVSQTAADPFEYRRPPVTSTSTYTGLGAESVSATDIARFAAPPLPDDVSRRIQAMIDVRGADTGFITAKGDRMFFTWRITGIHQVWRQDGPMAFPVQLTGGEDRTTIVGLAPDDSFLAVSRDIGGGENPGLYLLSPQGGALQVVQHTPKVQTFLEYISDDSKSLYYRANDVEASSFAIYRYDIADRKRERVFDQAGLWSIADSRGDAWLLVKQLGSSHNEIYRYDTKTRTLTPVLGQNEREDYRVAFGAKPDQVLVRTDKLGEYERLYSLENGKLAPITPDLQFDVGNFAIDRARTRIYYHVNENGYVRLAVLDAKTLRPIALPKFPDALAGAERISASLPSRNGVFVQLAFESSQLPPQSVTLDWRTKKLMTWRTAMTPEIDPKTFATKSVEYYPARDGTRIPMFVRRPATCEGPCPVIVSFHGGPEGQSTAGFSGTGQLFVDAGFVFVEPNVRGSTGYGKAWVHADDGPRRLAVITDIEDCARHIRASWGKDGKAPKIGVTGGSYGGYATLMAMTYFAGAYDAGVQSVGVSNLMTFLLNTAPYRRALRASEYGDPVKDKDALVQLSPITHVAKIRAPLLSIQGVNDPRVPVGEAMQIYKELEKRKIPGGLILFPDEGHGAQKRSNQVLSIGHTIAFFVKHLK